MPNVLMFLDRISPTEIIVIAVIAFLLFGAKKLPDAAKSFAKSIKEFKSEMKEVKDSVVEPTKETPPEKKDAA
jgi:sec-independent protein translocase protein TatA